MERALRDIVSSDQVSYECFDSDYSFDQNLILDPFKTIRTGEGFDVEGDPLAALEEELKPYRYVKLPEIPTFTGRSIPSIIGEVVMLI